MTNAGGPPFKDFRELARDDLLKGVTWNMVTPIELIQATIDGMVERRFGRIVNITSISVRMPVPGLDLSSGARAGLTAFLAGVARQVAHAGVTINNILPGFFDTDRYWAGVEATAKVQGKTREQFASERRGHGADAAHRRSGRARRRLRVPVQRARRLHHRPELAAGRRPVQQRVLRCPRPCRPARAERTTGRGYRPVCAARRSPTAKSRMFGARCPPPARSPCPRPRASLRRGRAPPHGVRALPGTMGSRASDGPE